MSAAEAARALKCADCGIVGRLPSIDDRAAADRRPTLRGVFGWHGDARPALLCPDCAGRRRARRKAERGAP